MAYATGFVHAQERYFEMDLLRRSAAGELSALFGPLALARDKEVRVHRLRARVDDSLRQIAGDRLPVLEAYRDGVNAGLGKGARLGTGKYYANRQTAMTNFVAALCQSTMPDPALWLGLKARVADPDPESRVAISGEGRTIDGRIAAWQTRPLPDGATLVAFSDVTARRGLEQALVQREQALAESQALKREFVGSVSYELRTPLTTIVGYSELLEMQADLKDINLVFKEGSPKSINVMADKERIRQVLTNLMTNSIKYGKNKGTTSVGIYDMHDNVLVEITDNGIGIGEEHLSRLFERFYRVDKSRARDQGGTGLGSAPAIKRGDAVTLVVRGVDLLAATLAEDRELKSKGRKTKAASSSSRKMANRAKGSGKPKSAAAGKSARRQV